MRGYAYTPIPGVARSKAWVCGRSLAGTVGSNPAGDIDVCLFRVWVLSGIGPCVGLLTRPEESYRVCVCVCMCVCLSVMVKPYKKRLWPGMESRRHRKKKVCVQGY